MAVFGNTELNTFYGGFFKIQAPIEASSTLANGDLVYYSSGVVTRRVTTSSDNDYDTDSPFVGWIMENGTRTINGVATSLPTSTLVNILLCTHNIYQILPSYTQAPAWTDIAPSTNTVGYTGRTVSGVYKVNFAQTTKGIYRPFGFDLTDVKTGYTGQKIQATPDAGDRTLCQILNAAKQVIL